MHAIVLAAVLAGGTPARAPDDHQLAARLTTLRASVDLFADLLEIMESDRLDVCTYFRERDLSAGDYDFEADVLIVRNCARALDWERTFHSTLGPAIRAVKALETATTRTEGNRRMFGSRGLRWYHDALNRDAVKKINEAARTAVKTSDAHDALTEAFWQHHGSDPDAMRIRDAISARAARLNRSVDRLGAETERLRTSLTPPMDQPIELPPCTAENGCRDI